MIIDRTVSQRLRILSLIAAFSVVVIHSSYWNIKHVPVIHFMEYWLSISLTVWAVPCFFVISGLLFANGLVKYGYFELLKKKSRTLLIPYVVWTIFGVVVATPLTMAANIIAKRALFCNTFWSFPTVWEKLDACLGITNSSYCNGPLWYIHCLMVLFILSPLFAYFYRKLPMFLMITGGILIFIHGHFPIVTSVKYSSIGYFCLGMSFNVFGKYYKSKPIFFWVSMVLAFLLSVLLAANDSWGVFYLPGSWTVLTLSLLWFIYEAVLRMEGKTGSQNRTEQNRTEQNRTEQNRTEQNRTEQNRTEQNRTEQNRTEQNRKTPPKHSVCISIFPLCFTRTLH